MKRYVTPRQIRWQTLIPNSTTSACPLLLRYKARSFPDTLSESEASAWETWRTERVKKQLPDFMKSLQRLATNLVMTNPQLFLLRIETMGGEYCSGSD